MKKKCVTALVLAAALACIPAAAFGASGSISSGGSGGGGGRGSSTSSGSTIVAGTGAKVNTPAGGPAAGTGETVVGDTKITFATGVAATAGLPEAAVAAINGINAGSTLSDVVKDVDVTGYKALHGTQAIVTKDVATDAVKTGATEVTLYVPNLVDGLQNVSVLFYDNVTGKWTLLPVTKVDPVTKTVVTTITGSGTYTVVYK